MLSAWSKLKNRMNITTDVETATGRYIDGKKEYFKICKIGAVENSKDLKSEKATNTSPKNILEIRGSAFSSDAGAAWSIPNSNIEIHVSSPNIWIINNTGFKITSGLVYIYYTK